MTKSITLNANWFVKFKPVQDVNLKIRDYNI